MKAKQQLALFADHGAARAQRMGSVEAKLWPDVTGDWSLSAQGWERGAQHLPVLVGVDEAGRGPLAGPVSVAAVVLSPKSVALLSAGNQESPLAVLDDSKKLSESKRRKLWQPVMDEAQAWAIVHLHAPHIDAVNILQATFHGMCIATELVLGLSGDACIWPDRPDLEVQDAEASQEACWYIDDIKPEGIEPRAHALVGGHVEARESCELLIDGNQPFSVRGAVAAQLMQRPVVKGDALSYNIAAASILAKVSRDAVMERCGELWPAYGLEGHKGYPTAKHREAVQAHGPCPIHRLSFRGSRRNS